MTPEQDSALDNLTAEQEVVLWDDCTTAMLDIRDRGYQKECNDEEWAAFLAHLDRFAAGDPR